MTKFLSTSFILLAAAQFSSAYWLMGAKNMLTIQRIDPIVNPGNVAGHVHGVVGGSNFGINSNTETLRKSECTSIPIVEDKSNYWFPLLYFQWKNGSFSSLDGGVVVYYLFDDKPGTVAFPDDLRLLSGDPTLRAYDANSHAQQAVTFLCLDFNGQTTKHNELPKKACPSGVRAQVNFQSCWDGKNTDSPDHKSHVAYKSGGPDSGTCSDPNFPVTIPRVFLEVYWATGDFDKIRNQAANQEQPFVFSNGDSTGYGYHADLMNGWDKGVLQKAIDGCNCNIYGDPTCCSDKGVFTLQKNGPTCRQTDYFNERTTGMLSTLPGRNPVQPAGTRATSMSDGITPAILSPVYVYQGTDKPTEVGTVVTPATPGNGGSLPAPVPVSSAAPVSVSSAAPVSMSSAAPVPVSSAAPAPTPVASSAPAPTPPASPVNPPAASPSSAPSTGNGNGDAPYTPPYGNDAPAAPGAPSSPPNGNENGNTAPSTPAVSALPVVGGGGTPSSAPGTSLPVVSSVSPPPKTCRPKKKHGSKHAHSKNRHGHSEFY